MAVQETTPGKGLENQANNHFIKKPTNKEIMDGLKGVPGVGEDVLKTSDEDEWRAAVGLPSLLGS